MANEKLPEVIEFKDLVKSIFESLKAAEAALGLKAKTFSRLSIQQIPLYESQIEHYINDLVPVFTFSIKEYKDARSFVAYYDKDIKRWFKLKKEIYKNKQAEFAERLYDLNDDSFINELGDIIISIRKEYHGFGIILQNWIKHLTVYTLFKSKKDFEVHTIDEYERKFDITNWRDIPNNTCNDVLNQTFKCIFMDVMFDSLLFSAIQNLRKHSFEHNVYYYLIKKSKATRFENGECIGLLFSFEDEKSVSGFTYFVNKNVDTDSWETICVCVGSAVYPLFTFIEFDSQTQLQYAIFSFDGKKFNLTYNSSKSSLATIFSDGFYVIPEEECTNSEYITNVIFKDINKDLYAKDETEKICAMINNLYLSNSFDIKNFVLSLLNKEVQPTNEL